MSQNTTIISSHHHLEAVTGSTSQLHSIATDVSGAFPRDVRRPLAQRSVAAKSFPTRCATKEEADSLYSQLWHACAGSLVTLPRLGSRVVYFPQGHIEQVAACTNQGVDMQMPRYNLPSQILCRALNMTLSAEQETDEVYAQMTLVPELEKNNCSGDIDEETPFCPKYNLPMFIKLLTASDTSTHGGFSVPRRAAEECLPPLDFQQSPPTQDLIAKDLHGVQWKFRHIYRGHPKRHLLTTGWSVFVSQKRLVAGDAVIFLRGENGELRLGVRHSTHQQSSVTSSSLLSSHSMHLGVLAAAAHAVSTKSMFSIFYNPRASPAEFVIPYHKYVSALKNSLSVGMRFKMRFETEETSERRYMGTITGVGDFDAAQWPNSKWRCLKVGWDEQVVSEIQERVSPWEIEPFIAPTVLSFPEPRVTRLRLSNSSPVVDLPLPVLVTEEEQEAMAKSACRTVKPDDCNIDKRLGFESCTLSEQSDRQLVDTSSIKMSGMAQEFQVPLHFPSQPLDTKQHHMKLRLQQWNVDNVNKVNDSTSSTLVKELYAPDLHLGATPQDMQNSQSKNSRGFLYGQSRNHLTLWLSPDNTSMHSSAQSGVLPVGTTDWFTNIRSSSFPENTSDVGALENSSTSTHSKIEQKLLEPETREEQFSSSWRAQQDEHGPAVTDKNCRLFGFSLSSGYVGKDFQLGTSEPPDSNVRSTCMPHASTSYHSFREVDYMSKLPSHGKQDTEPLEGMDHDTTQTRCCKEQNWLQIPLRTRVKVYKQGAVGRAVDILKFEGYDDFVKELRQLFKIEEALNEPGSGWQLVYIDHEGDMLLVGDDPWPEFCKIVQKIRILSPLEVHRMSRGSNLEEDQAIKVFGVSP